MITQAAPDAVIAEGAIGFPAKGSAAIVGCYLARFRCFAMAR